MLSERELTSYQISYRYLLWLIISCYQIVHQTFQAADMSAFYIKLPQYFRRGIASCKFNILLAVAAVSVQTSTLVCSLSFYYTFTGL